MSTAEYVLWGIVAHAEHPIRIVGGSNSECQRQANVRRQLPSYQCLRIVPEGEPYGDAPVRHRDTGRTGTALVLSASHPELPDWHINRKTWVFVQWDDDGFTCWVLPSDLEYLDEQEALTA